MKSNIRFIVIAAIVLLILGGAAAALVLTAPKEEEETQEETVVESKLIFDKNPEDIVKIAVKNEFGEYDIDRIQSGEVSAWTVLDYVDAPLDGTFINNALEESATLTASKTVTENAEDLSIYGLTEPRAEYTVSFSDSASTEVNVKIGDPVPGSQVYSYMSMGEGKVVFTVKTSDVGFALEDSRSCVNKTVFTQKTPENEDDKTDYSLFKTLTVKRSDLDYDVVIEYDTRLDDENSIVSNSTSYRMTSPVTLDLNPDKCSGVITGMFGLTASDFAEIKPADISKYGLDEPRLTVTADTNSGEFSLIIGGKAENGGYYGMAGGIDMVYIFDEASLPWLTFDTLDITANIIMSHYIFNIDTIDIDYSGKSVGFELLGEGADDLGVKESGKELDAEAFKKLYQFILGAPSEQLYFGEVSGEPDVRISVKASDGNDVLEFYKTENRRSVIVLNGKPSFTCTSAYVDRLIENVQKYLDGEEMITNW